METPPPIRRDPTRVPGGARRRGLRRALLLAVAVVVLVLLVVTLAIGGLWFRTTRELEKIAVAIREEGYPLTVEQLNDWYAPGQGSEDAGFAFIQLFDSYMAGLEHEEEVLVFHAHPGIHDPLTETQLEVSIKHLEVNTNYLKNLHRLVAEHESVRYPVDVTEGFQTGLAHLPNIRRATRMMALEALVAADSGDETKTMDAILGAFGVAESLRHEPIVQSQLIRVACLQISFIASEHAINRVALSPASLERLQATVNAIDCDGPMALALVGERCFLYSGVKRYGFAVIDSEADDWEPQIKIPGIGLYLDWELLHIVEALNDLIAVGEAEPVHRRELGERVENRLEGNQGVGYFLAYMLVPSFARIYEAENRASAYLSALSSSLAALQFQNDHARMPNDLQELVPEYVSEVPTDPFSGNPLRMRSDETGFIVYSLGHDRDDDGGIPPPAGKKITEDGDIVFRVFR